MEYLIPQNKNPQLVQMIQNNQIQRNIIEYQLEGEHIHIQLNTQFIAEIEQSINEHFTFMLRVKFYNGVFEEITDFVQVYQDQYNQSQTIHEIWKQVDILITATNLKKQVAISKQEEIQRYKDRRITVGEFTQYKQDIVQMFLDEKFMVDKAIENQMAEKELARREAEAQSAIEETEHFLQWLFAQKKDQLLFKQDLQQIEDQWKDDYNTYEQGRSFVQNVHDNQIEIYSERQWNQGSWGEQLQKQMQQANPYFTTLYEKYMSCFKFFLDQYELDQLTINRRKIQELKIDIAQREAEREFNESFVVYWKEQHTIASKKLIILENKDQVKRLQECHAQLSQQLMNVQKVHNSLDLKVSYTQIRVQTERLSYSFTAVSDVKLEKDRLDLKFENALKVEDSKETIEQRKIIKKISAEIKKYENELSVLKNKKEELKKLEQEPEEFKTNKETKLSETESQKESYLNSFQRMLNETAAQNYDHLLFGANSMRYIVGALCRYIVIKKDSCCCNSTKELHLTDFIYYSDLEKELAYEIRRIQDVPNEWFISNQDRIAKANQLKVIDAGTRFLLNNNILVAFRNDDGRRQIKNDGYRDFNAHGSIVKTINELCQLVVADYKLDERLDSQTTANYFERWRKFQKDAKENGRFGANQIPMD